MILYEGIPHHGKQKNVSSVHRYACYALCTTRRKGLLLSNFVDYHQTYYLAYNCYSIVQLMFKEKKSRIYKDCFFERKLSFFIQTLTKGLDCYL